jgi:NAD(P)-dependent dehydrogenase (short-subunit alcohol dehydrogenase family)
MKPIFVVTGASRGIGLSQKVAGEGIWSIP